MRLLLPYKKYHTTEENAIGILKTGNMTSNEGGSASLVVSLKSPRFHQMKAGVFYHYVDSRSRMHGEVQ